MKFRVGYFAENGGAVERGSLPEEIGIHAVPIPGNVFGAPEFPAVASAYVHIGEQGTLNFAGANGALEKIARPLTDAGARVGLRVSPMATRLARLGILASYVDTGNGFPGYVSLLGAPNETLSIVFFDRPCELSGQVHIEGKTLTYDVHIRGPGIHVLAMSRLTPETFSVRLASLESPVTVSIVPSM